jgi:hypothetical protein
MTNPPESRAANRLWLWLLLLVAAIGLGVGVWAWQKYDPFIGSRPAVKAARELVEVARKRPLTADEFEQALALAEHHEPLAQLSVIAVLQLEAERDPSRREAAAVALQRCMKSSDDGVCLAAAAAVARVKAKAGK